MKYRATPQSTIKISLFEACASRKMDIGQPDTPKNPAPRPIHDRIAWDDSKEKEIMKWYADRNKKTKPSPLCLGDQVLIKQKRLNKLSPPYNPKQYTATKRKASIVTVQIGDNQVTRNSSLFKQVSLNASHKEEEDSESVSDSEYNPHSQQDSPETPLTPTHNPPPLPPLRKRLPPTKLNDILV